MSELAELILPKLDFFQKNGGWLNFNLVLFLSLKNANFVNSNIYNMY